MVAVIQATAGASDVVDSLGVVGSLAVVIILLVSALIWMVKKTNDDLQSTHDYVKKTEHAVNGVGPEEHRMYDKITFIQENLEKLVEAQHVFDAKGWNSLPLDMATAPALTETIRALQDRDQHLVETVDRIEKRLVDHIEWEENQKYKNGGRLWPNENTKPS